MIPSRDAAHCTPDSLAAAREWQAANAVLAELHERERKYGPDAVSPDEHIRAHQRIATATAALTIPDHLLRHNPHEQHRQAQDAWATAHGMDRAQFERHQQAQLTRPKPSRQTTTAKTRTRKTPGA